MKKHLSKDGLFEQSKAPLSGLNNSLIGVPSRVFETKDLFSSADEIGIIHDGAMYRLRVTRAGKLILTK